MYLKLVLPILAALLLASATDLHGADEVTLNSLGMNIETDPRGKLDEARKKAANRSRRIIYNNDGDDIWAKGADTVEQFLALRHTPLLGTQVDSNFYCTTQSFNLFTHDTRVAEVFLSREGTFAHNNLKTFLDKKTDPLRMSCAFARKHKLEIIWV